MTSGSYHNVERAGFVRTPPVIAQLLHGMVTLPGRAPFAAGDLTCGKGDFLAPWAVHPEAYLVGTELSRERAAEAQKALPNAHIYASALEHCRLPANCLGLLLANPPYLRADGERTERAMIRRMLKHLMPHGVFIGIVPMRQWDVHMADLCARTLYDVQAFKFPDLPEADEAAFSRYTGGVIIGKKRPIPLKKPDEAEVARLKGWRYRTKGLKAGECPWMQGYPLPELPTLPWPDAERYAVPALAIEPEVTVLHADVAEVHAALETQGVQKTDRWRAATTYHDRRLDLLPAAMPLVGKVHLAGLILGTGLLDGRPLTGPDGGEYLFSTFITTKWQEVEIDDDERARHVVDKKQLTDLPILGVLNLSTGKTEHYYGAEAYAYLDSWYPILAKIILQEYQPVYDLEPDEWMLRVALSTATDKSLPGSEPGLAPAQLHRVFAHWYAIGERGKVAFQGERGVGKTRILIVLQALYMYYWAHRNDPEFLRQQKIPRRPRWVRGVRHAWRRSRLTQGDEPKALPLAVVTPKRVTRTWAEEFALAWPDAKVVEIRSYHDVDTWMRLCASGACTEGSDDGKRVTRTFSAVVAIFSQSTTRAMDLRWRPAVIEVPQGMKIVNDLEAEGEPEYNEAGHLVAKLDPATGEPLTKEVPYSHFFCSQCGGLIEASPQSLAVRSQEEGIDDDAQEEREFEYTRPVEHLEWFERQPRWCERPIPLKERRGRKASRARPQVCGAPLWTRTRREDLEERFPAVSFATWLRGSQAAFSTGAWTGGGLTRAGTSRRRSTVRGSADRFEPSGLSRIIDEHGTRVQAPPGSFSPFDYYRHYFGGCCANVGLDEYHNMQGSNSDVARAGHRIMNGSQSRVPASGTHWEGMEKFFHGWFRFAPEFWRSLGIGWRDLGRAVREFGVVHKITKEFVTVRKGTAEVERSISVRPASGISARFLPLLLPYMIYLDILDVGQFMPPKEEIPVLVDMRDEEIARLLAAWEAEKEEAKSAYEGAQAEYQRVLGLPDEEDALLSAELALAEQSERVQQATEALAKLRRFDMEGTYRSMEAELRSRARAGDVAVQVQMQTLLARWVAYPFDPPLTITRVLRGEWGEKVGEQVVYAAPTLDWNYITPPERKLREIVAAQLSSVIEGTDPPRTRSCLVFYQQSQKRNLGERLALVLAEFDPWLLPDQVKPENREHAIRQARAEGKRTILAQISRIAEGLNLQVLDTPICYELGKNAKETDQAVGRCWRLGKKEPVSAFYLACLNSATHDKLRRQASASGAASLFAGNSPRGALAAYVGANKVALARVADRLETIEDLSAAFAKRREEWEEAVREGAREFLGYDKDPLLDRIAALRAVLAREAAEVSASGPALPASDPFETVAPALLWGVTSKTPPLSGEDLALTASSAEGDEDPLEKPCADALAVSPGGYSAEPLSWEWLDALATSDKRPKTKPSRRRAAAQPPDGGASDSVVQITLFDAYETAVR